ncbi:MAG: UvrD-helicase domain-containing protein, partial [Clostridia bacterium]
MKETDVAYRGDMTPTGPQREAITCPLGDVVVTAGPGSGKTRVLVGRMEYLLSRGVPPEKMAAITFTKRAAAEMKERLRTRLAERWVGARRDG